MQLSAFSSALQGFNHSGCLALFDLVTVYNMRDVCIILHLYMRVFAGPGMGEVVVFYAHCIHCRYRVNLLRQLGKLKMASTLKL